MIGTVTVRVSSAHPDIPLREVPVFAGSACTVGVEGVPAYFGGVAVTGVSVGVENALGEVRAVAARRSGCMWAATIGADFFQNPGSIRNGLRVEAVGLEEDGTTQATWTLGAGDICIISADGVPAPGERWQNVHLRDEVPASPVKGDLAKVGADWKLYTGSSWETIGGGGGGGGSVVESDTNPGYAANADAANHAAYAGTAESANEAVHAGEAAFALGAGSAARAESALSDEDGNRIADTYGRKDELLVSLDLVGDDPYTVQLYGVVQTFEQVKEFAETRNAVIRHGQGTYRVTYVGASEMMWDCTGTVQGAVKTGQIHMFAQGDVVQLVPAKTLALKSDIGTPVEVAGEYDDGTTFSFNFLTAGA